VLSSIRQSLDFKKGISILDVGCSSGIWIMVQVEKKKKKKKKE
jgi:cyclopropane fatty-acyl-phospholipid synthase-like methyltransferase